MKQGAASLRERSEGLVSSLPGLLAAADQLAASVQTGEHGRRKSGLGDEFWQYRQAVPGDAVRDIDWRRSARSDVHFVRQKEWQAMQKVSLWVDSAQSMQFTSSPNHPTKLWRAQLLILATAILLQRGGERISLLGDESIASANRDVIERVAKALSSKKHDALEFSGPNGTGLSKNSRVVMISDFLGDISPTQDLLHLALKQGVKGAIVQILDPQEVAFPFEGRNIFESPLGHTRHETLKAGGLREKYQQRLQERQGLLRELAGASGWQFTIHLSDTSPLPLLLWLYRAISEGP